jgi:hypothetical protein
VDSTNLPDDYRPSQAYWSESTGFDWAHQTKRGVVIARCEYADQYTLQQRRSNVPLAMRDFVLIPSADGSAATLVIDDRVDTTAAERKLFLRFRSQAPWKLDGELATIRHGKSGLVLTAFDARKTKPELVASTQRDCFKGNVTRGNCDAARFPVIDYRRTIGGPQVTVTHVLEAGAEALVTGKRDRRPAAISGPGFRGVTVPYGSSEAVVVWATKPGNVVVPSKPGAAVIVHDAVPAGRAATVSGKRSGDDCELTIQVGGKGTQAALVAFLAEDCSAEVDPQATAPAATAAPADAPPTVPAADPVPRQDVVAAAEPSPSAGQDNAEVTAPPRSPRSGCCGASTTATEAMLNVVWVLLALLLRRRRRAGLRGQTSSS